jgi:hypothetical protein
MHKSSVGIWGEKAICSYKQISNPSQKKPKVNAELEYFVLKIFLLHFIDRYKNP